MRTFRFSFYTDQLSASYDFEADDDAEATTVATVFRSEIPGCAVLEVWEGEVKVHSSVLPKDRLQ